MNPKNRERRRGAGKRSQADGTSDMTSGGSSGSAPDRELTAATGHYRAGRYAEAEAASRRVLTARPGNPDALTILGAAVMDQGRLDEALSHFQAILATHPASVPALYNLALTLKRQGKTEQAVSAYRRTLAVKPDLVEAHNNLGNLLKDQGRFDEAAAAYRDALTHAPGHAKAHNNLGIALEKQGQLTEAAASYRRAIELEPGFAEAHTNLGNVLYEQDEFDDAISAHERAIALDPGLATAFYNLGNALKAVGALDAAIARYREAIALAPDHADAHCNLGAALHEVGDESAAIASDETALALDPGLAFAYYHLALAKHTGPDDALAARIAVRIDDPSTQPRDRGTMLLALANIHDRAGDYDKAFSHAANGNRLIRGTIEYSSADGTAITDEIIRSFPGEILARPDGFGVDTEAPIFIVGMPRSGKSLVERVLVTHPSVREARENRELARMVSHFPERLESRRPYPACMKTLGPGEGRRIGETFVESLRRHWPDAARLAITHPFNFYYLGLIRLVLPQARIIHCVRDPLDTCLYCYFKNFAAMPFAFDLTELGDFYRSYRRLMDHWRALLPAAILEVQYERLVTDPVETRQEILAHCGLESDAAVGDVPGDIDASEIGHWRHYAEQLRPLRDRLSDFLTPGD